MSTAMRCAPAGCRSRQLEGSFVTTIEGLSRDRSHPVQQAFAADMVPQCGYCIPGVIMAAAALIDRNDSPTDAQIDAAITNICRCGIYPRLRESIRRAIRIKTGREQVDGAPPPGIEPGATPPAPCRRCGRSRAAAEPRAALIFCRHAYRPVQQPLIRFAAQAVHHRAAHPPPGSKGVSRCARH